MKMKPAYTLQSLVPAENVWVVFYMELSESIQLDKVLYWAVYTSNEYGGDEFPGIRTTPMVLDPGMGLTDCFEANMLGQFVGFSETPNPDFTGEKWQGALYRTKLHCKLSPTFAKSLPVD